MTEKLDTALLDGTDLKPFGRVVTADAPGLTLADVPIDQLLATTLATKVLVLRGFGLLDKTDLEAYCLAAGELVQWEFGTILDLVVQDDPKNYLFDSGDVPFHWDGAWSERAPRYFLFQCRQGCEPGSGGETVFCDSTEVYRQAPQELRELWAHTTVTYRTDRLAHYGGTMTHPLLATHPATGETTIRYAEPLDPARYKNPLFLTVEGVSSEGAVRVMEDLRDRLHDPRYCYDHAWQTGDIVIAENHALLHGRNRFTGPTTRHMQRIQII
ncbi:TauD/TfdA family dioxygenase [Nocardia sp. CDC159]|uniref:TauD/TfdA family dioxygenase n=1 Tax=Nocardia pulmonis TaxID=2951408 RepID=A0A9X2EE62_9NOCA|nr:MULTISPECIES: TauD/TfdA family dioxygenase [Nocardia]MCM6778685.1 TauD/TfdA family dioxygenase [Nocardia pulmonis]MCM6791574.1 TauD/TfdA family dioxygenase [Nocardia sp. CDC159]